MHPCASGRDVLDAAPLPDSAPAGRSAGLPDAESTERSSAQVLEDSRTVHSGVVLALAGVLAAGVAAQWVGWRLRVPAIVFLLAVGLLAGPITGVLDPDDLLGDLLFPFVSVAVAVILFEGAFALGVSGVREAGRTVWMLLTVGAATTMVLVAIAGRYILDVPWSLAWVLAGVLVVTGPTVIGPIVRAIGLRGRLAAVLEAEGTLIDPLGAILTVIMFQAFYDGAPGGSLPLELLVTLLVGSVIGAAAAGVMTFVLARYLLPDELHNVATLAMVVVAFAAADAVQLESGLVAVTVMGLVLGGQRRVEVHDVLAFNETLRTLFIAGLFILLGARIAPETLTTLEWRNVVFLVALVLVVRPVSVLLSTVRSPLARAERGFLAATAPRGIVAAAIASVFSLQLDELGEPGSQALVSATFTVIVGTVLLSGFGARPLARRLGLIDDTSSSVAVLGTNDLATELAEVLERHGIRVDLISLDRAQVSSARLAGRSVTQGSVLDDDLLGRIAGGGASAFVAMSSSDEANVLACRRVALLLSRRDVFRVPPRRREHARLRPFSSPAGRLIMDGVGYAELDARREAGWFFRATPLTESFEWEAYRAEYPDALVVGVIRGSTMTFSASGHAVRLRSGDRVVGFVPAAAGPDAATVPRSNDQQMP